MTAVEALGFAVWAVVLMARGHYRHLAAPPRRPRRVPPADFASGFFARNLVQIRAEMMYGGIPIRTSPHVPEGTMFLLDPAALPGVPELDMPDRVVVVHPSDVAQLRRTMFRVDT